MMNILTYNYHEKVPGKNKDHETEQERALKIIMKSCVRDICMCIAIFLKFGIVQACVRVHSQPPHGGHGNKSLLDDLANGSSPVPTVWWRPGHQVGSEVPYVCLAGQLHVQGYIMHFTKRCLHPDWVF